MGKDKTESAIYEVGIGKYRQTVPPALERSFTKTETRVTSFCVTRSTYIWTDLLVCPAGRANHGVGPMRRVEQYINTLSNPARIG